MADLYGMTARMHELQHLFGRVLSRSMPAQWNGREQSNSVRGVSLEGWWTR